jgi:hypothetical protein
MNVLYSLKYKKRFYDIIDRISENDTSILDLCFGDTIIADECKRRKISWTGFDLNSYFVLRAKKKGYLALEADLVAIEKFPIADVCIMCGSLYHFIDEIESVLSKMLQSAPKIILSEPVQNLSSQKGLLGSVAKIMTNAGKGHENFRFNKETIIETLEVYKTKLHFNYTIVSTQRDILIEITHDRN